MRKPKAIRQGDLLLVRRRRLPRGATPRSESLLRVHGEEGHAHVLRGAELFENNGQPIAVVPKGGEARLEHEEHPDITIPAGIWEIRRAREYEPGLETTEAGAQEQPKVRPYTD